MYNIDLANVKSIVADIVAKHNVENVAFVGCGASKAELYPAKYFLANCSKKLRVAHYTANEFNYDTPDWLGDTTVVITASLGGSTPETVKANSVAKAAGATVVSVTHAAGSALTKEADYTIVHGFEANYAAKLEKMGYVLALAVEILQQVEGFDKYDKMIEGLTNVFEAAENAANSARKSAKEFAEKYKDAPVVYVMSSGASMEVAYSTSICLMMEMQWVNSGSFHSGEFFHGPFEIVDKDSALHPADERRQDPSRGCPRTDLPAPLRCSDHCCGCKGLRSGQCCGQQRHHLLQPDDAHRRVPRLC